MLGDGTQEAKAARSGGSGPRAWSALLHRQRTQSPRMLPAIMSLQQIKMSVSAVWVLIATVIAIAMAVDMSWTKGLMIAAFGLLPPLAMLLLWNEPARTMSERINDARQ